MTPDARPAVILLILLALAIVGGRAVDVWQGLP